jgi:flagellin-like hook-associated protein FlgL
MSDIVLSAGVRQNLLSLQNTASLMSTTQNRLATGKKVNSALDNPTNFFTSQGLQNRASDLNALLDSIGQAQSTLQAANQGITSLTSLVQSAKSIANQARQIAQPQQTYQAVSATGSVDVSETQGSFTGGTFTTPTAAGTLDLDVTVSGTTVNLHAAVASGADISATRDAINAAITSNATTNGHVTATISGGKLKIDDLDSDTDVTVQANATSASVGLTTDSSTDTAIDSTNLLDAVAGLAGTTLTVTANGGTPKNITFGNAADQVSTFSELQAALNGSNVSASLTTNGSAQNLTLTVAGTTGTQNSLTIAGDAGAILGGNITNGTTTGTANAITPDSSRANFETQYNNLLSQIDALAGDSSYGGINLLNGDTLKVVFNEKGTSSLTIQGVTLNSAGLGLDAISSGGFQSNTTIDATLDKLNTALTTLRTQASNFGSNVTVVQTRQDFTKNLINTLQTGADSLVLADTNEEGANMLALQTRQQLSTTALSLANQANQAVLRLF